MKCPKCGYNSFDYLESCKKCSNDLAGHKARYGLRSLLFPGKETAPPTTEPDTGQEPPSDEATAPTGTVDFGFDFMGDQKKEKDGPSESSLDDLLGDSTPTEGAAEAPAADASELEPEPSPEEFEPSDDIFSDSGAEEPSALDLSWDEEPPSVTPEPAPEDSEQAEEMFSGAGTEAPPDLDLSWDEEPPAETTAAAPEELEPADEVSADNGAKDSSDLDLSWDEEPSSTTAEPARDGFAEGSEEGEKQVDLSELFAEADAPLEEAAFDEQPADPGGLLPEELPELPTESHPGEGLAEPFPDSLDKTIAEGESAAPEEFPAPGEDTAEAETSADWTGVEEEFGVPEQLTPQDEEGQGEPLPALEPETVPPSSDTEAAVSPESVPPLSARLGAGATDLVILGLVFVLFVAAGEAVLSPDQGGGILPTPEALLELSTPYFLVLFAVCFGYFTLFHFLTGQTPGKMLFRLRVEGEQGATLLLSQAFLRSVGGLLSLLPAGLGYLGIALDRERRGWNDRLAGSRVVRFTGVQRAEDPGKETLASGEG